MRVWVKVQFGLSFTSQTSGRSFWLIRLMTGRVWCESTGTSVAAFDPGSTPNGWHDRLAVMCCHERRPNNELYILYTSSYSKYDRLVKQYNFCRRWQQAVEKGYGEPYLILDSFIFWANFYYCVSWCLYQLTEAFVLIWLFNLMPYLYFSHRMCWAGLPQIIVHFPSAHERKYTIKTSDPFWFGKPSAFHTWQTMYKNLYVKYQY